MSPGLLSVPVSLTRTGLPRIIPAHHRRAIRKSDSKADMLVKLYLSLFSLSRVILLAKKVSKATFANIVQPADPCMGLIGSIKEKAKELILRYVPDTATYPLNQGITWEPTWKTVPSVATAKAVLFYRKMLVAV